jgi:RecA/RadA recombinase
MVRKARCSHSANYKATVAVMIMVPPVDMGMAMVEAGTEEEEATEATRTVLSVAEATAVEAAAAILDCKTGMVAVDMVAVDMVAAEAAMAVILITIEGEIVPAPA